jgi:2,4-dienoyl-CoA reductase-like NADH-dependent reductase (Old Yellow Enzyme family)/thioredoxin reductase
MPGDAFASIAIGPVRLRNRLASAPVKTALGDASGVVSPRHLAYYRRRAEGGAGLVIVEPMFVDPVGREHPRQLGVHTDQCIAGLRLLTAEIQRSGAAAFAHLNHAGRAANPKAIGRAPEAPSAVPCPATGATPEPMSEARIGQVIAAYGEAARRLREAGFDGIEVQLGLGYLPAQFLSARTNLRGDDYGLAAGGGWRFVEELLRTVRGAIGTGMALAARVSGSEQVEGGLQLPDAVELGKRLEQSGVQAIHIVSGSACDSPPWYYQHMALPSGVNEELARQVRRQVSLPVIVAGRLGDPERIREVLASDMADLVALGRPLVADPDLPRKMQEGREDDIILCGSCLQGCLAKVKAGGPIGCIVNPEVGHEYETAPAAAHGRRLVVVGGGPAGMRAALLGDRAGYAVTLLERGKALGGQFALAGLTRGKETMRRPFNSLVRSVERSGIDHRVGVEATTAEIVALVPDEVVIATGSRPAIPPVPGLRDALTAEMVLTGTREAGRRVLVLGGGLVGIEMAEHLAAGGHEVVVVEMLADVARDMEAVTRAMTLRRIKALPVTVLTETRLNRVENGEAWVRTADGKETSLGRFDSFLVATGHQSHDPLSQALRDAGLRVTVIGDAHQPGQLLDASLSAREAILAMQDSRAAC